MEDSSKSFFGNEELIAQKNQEIFNLQIELDELTMQLNDFKITSKIEIQKLETKLKQKDENIELLQKIINMNSNAKLVIEYEDKLKKIEKENSNLKRSFILLKSKTNSSKEKSVDRPHTDQNIKSENILLNKANDDFNEDIKECIKSLKPFMTENGHGKEETNDHHNIESFKTELVFDLSSNKQQKSKSLENIQPYIEMIKLIEDENKNLLSKNEEFAKKNQQLEQMAKDMKNLNKKNELRILQVEESKLKLIEEIDTKNLQIKEFEKEIEKEKREKDDYVHLTRKTTLLKDESSVVITEMKSELIDLQNEINTLRLKSNMLEHENNELKECLEQNHLDYEHKIQKLDTDLSRANSKITELIEKNDETLSKLEKTYRMKGLMTEHMEENHALEIKKLNETIAQLKKELGETEIQLKLCQTDIKKNNQNENKGNRKSEMINDENQSLRFLEAVEEDGPQMKSFNISLNQSNDSIDHTKKELNDDFLKKDSNVKNKLQDLVSSPGNVLDRKISMDNYFENIKPLSLYSSIKTNWQQVIPDKLKNSSLEMLQLTNSELQKQFDDPTINLIQELDEKNTEIQTLREKIRVLEDSQGVEKMRQKIDSLELENKHLLEDLKSEEKFFQEQLSHKNRELEEILDSLTQIKMKFCTLSSEKDVIILNFNRKIRKLNHQVSFYESQISDFNQSRRKN
jgi:hypothetical protein